MVLKLEWKRADTSLNVSDTAKLTDGQTAFTVVTSPNTKTMGMQLNWTQGKSQASTCSLGDFLAKVSAMLENKKDLTIVGEHCFLNSQGFYKTADPSIFYSRMLETYYLTKMEEPFKQSLKFLTRWGIMFNGKCIIPKNMGFHKRERECSLRDILEKNVDQKYFANLESGKKLSWDLDKSFNAKNIRRLTPVECERLQGFSDDYTKYGRDGELISDSQRYKCLGNAVTVNVVTYIMNNWDLKGE